MTFLIMWYLQILVFAGVIHIPDTLGNHYMTAKEKVISILKCIMWPYYLGLVIYVLLKESVYKYVMIEYYYWCGNFLSINLEK